MVWQQRPTPNIIMPLKDLCKRLGWRRGLKVYLYLTILYMWLCCRYKYWIAKDGITTHFRRTKRAFTWNKNKDIQ